MSELSAIILAAGQGKRMHSALPKVLHLAAGRPLLCYPVRVAERLGVRRVVVVVSPESEAAIREMLAQAFPGLDIVTRVQREARGTGDAASAGVAAVDTPRTMILYGDTPLVRPADVAELDEALRADDCPLAFLSAIVSEPRGYGRVLRDALGRVTTIREHRDLVGPAELAVNEVNAGVYVAETAELVSALGRLSPENAQGEYYLTDIVADLAREQRVVAVKGDADALVGVNDRAQLRQAEQLLWARKATELGLRGVTIRGEVYVDDSVSVEPDAVLEPGVRLRGATSVGSAAFIDVGCVVTDSKIHAGAELLPYSVVTQSEVYGGAHVGPFSHLRPGSTLETGAKVGGFVETKNARLRPGAKANHLAYLGDADIGERVNVGAGVIVCNYDGFRKHRTTIGADTFIGSDSQLIAPVTIGKNAYVATATSVTHDVPDDALAIGRTRQQNKLGYAATLKERLAQTAKK